MPQSVSVVGVAQASYPRKQFYTKLFVLNTVVIWLGDAIAIPNCRFLTSHREPEFLYNFRHKRCAYEV